MIQGTPAIDLTAPAGTADTPRRAAMPPPATPAAHDPAPPPTTPERPPAAGTLEDSAPDLRARLARLALAPSPAAYLEAAASYRGYGVTDRAFDLITEGLTRFPRDGRLHAAAAAAWRDWGFPERGLRDAHLAVHYAPDAAETHTALATVLWALDQRPAALEAFAAAARLASSTSYARENWCRALRALAVPPPFECTAPPRRP